VRQFIALQRTVSAVRQLRHTVAHTSTLLNTRYAPNSAIILVSATTTRRNYRELCARIKQDDARTGKTTKFERAATSDAASGSLCAQFDVIQDSLSSEQNAVRTAIHNNRTRKTRSFRSWWSLSWSRNHPPFYGTRSLIPSLQVPATEAIVSQFNLSYRACIPQRRLHAGGYSNRTTRWQWRLVPPQQS
jgi:hypothetical protein